MSPWNLSRWTSPPQPDGLSRAPARPAGPLHHMEAPPSRGHFRENVTSPVMTVTTGTAGTGRPVLEPKAVVIPTSDVPGGDELTHHLHPILLSAPSRTWRLREPCRKSSISPPLALQAARQSCPCGAEEKHRRRTTASSRGPVGEPVRGITEVGPVGGVGRAHLGMCGPTD